MLGLDLGLADLFDEDVLAALEWLQEGRIELNGQTPLDHINGALRDVQKILDAARNVG